MDCTSTSNFLKNEGKRHQKERALDRQGLVTRSAVLHVIQIVIQIIMILASVC